MWAAHVASTRGTGAFLNALWFVANSEWARGATVPNGFLLHLAANSRIYQVDLLDNKPSV